MNLATRLTIILCVLYVAFLLAGATSQLVEFIHRYFILRERANLYKVYSGNTTPGTWAVVTGASSGQGREFALQLAERGFNLVLIGSVRCKKTAELAESKGVRTLIIVKDFGKSFEPAFFDDIKTALEPLDVAILVNNVGHRTGWKPYHEAPVESLSATIACGTLVQTRLTHMLLPQLTARLSNHPSRRSAIIFITAQCTLPNVGLAAPGYIENPITVPYLATYEASNAFGYYHASSLIKEYTPMYKRLDLLNITPGAVLTENTAHTLSGTPFAVNAEAFVSTVLRFMGGNVENGSTCAHWGHALSAAFVGIAPWYKESTLQEVGETLTRDYMNRYKERQQRYVVNM